MPYKHGPQWCNDWQNRLIHHNFLTIGYLAWDGYIHVGRGLVVCNVVDAVSATIDWSVDTVTFYPTFVPLAQIAQYLEALNLEAESVTALLPAIATYDPTQAIGVLITRDGTVDISLLQNLAISPADCYAEVQHRWAEFRLDTPVYPTPFIP